ncbi:MAG: hypothetical protein MMC23_003019 [Stictis urceolatum]|nr:hypothetical protein [Stictis urceolata]
MAAPRSLVTTAASEWSDSSTDVPETDIQAALRLLNPSLQQLHLSPASSNLYFAEYFPITSLHLNAGQCGLGYINRQVDKSILLGIFHLPSLERLSLDGVRRWTSFDNECSSPATPEDLFSSTGSLSSPSRTPEHHFSNITSLSFTYSTPIGPDLYELLKWPKALKSFYFVATTDDDDEDDEDDDDSIRYGPPGTLTIAARFFAEALEPHHEFFEEIFINSENARNSCRPHDTMQHIRHFTRLKRLGIPKWFIALDRGYVAKEPMKSEAWPITSDLPPNLEEPQVQFPLYNHWNWYLEDFKYPDVDEAPGELSGWLCEIAANKKTRYPKLWRVACWSGGVSVPEFVNVGKLDACRKALAAFERKGIEFGWAFGAPPMSTPYREVRRSGVYD